MNDNYLLLSSDKYKTSYIKIKYFFNANEFNATNASLLSLYLTYVNKKYPTYKKAINHLDSLYGVNIDSSVSLRGEDIVLDFSISFISNRYLNKEGYLDEVIETFFQYLFEPLENLDAFDKDIFDLKQNELKDRIEHLYDDKMAYAIDSFFKIFAKDYPLSINTEGSLTYLENINEENLYNFYLEMIKQTPYVSAILNDSDYEKIKGNLEKNILKTTFNKKFNHYFIKLDELEETIVKQDIVQSKLVIGYAYKDKVDKETYYINLLINSLLGMSSNSYLFKIIREKENLCYSIRSSYDQYSNSFFIIAGIEKHNYEKTIKLVEEIIENIKDCKISENDFKDAKTVLIDQLNKLNDSQSNYLNYLVNRQFQGFSISIEDDISYIKKIKVEEVIDVFNNIKLKTKFLLSGEKNE